VSGTADMITVLLDDHRAVERIFTELEGGEGEPEHRRALADSAIALLQRHMTAEDEYLYPTVREAVPGGAALADRELREHASALDAMRALRGVSAADPQFDRLLRDLMVDIRGHLAEEETDVFPRLREACSEQELTDLAARARAG
jgi:hemerythrin superfamily protein